jgi:hypothetical protein
LVQPNNEYRRTHLTRDTAPKVTDFAGWRALCEHMAADDLTILEGLRAGLWPVEAKPHITEFIARLGRDREGWMKCAAAKTLNGQNAGVGMSNDANSDAAATAVRVALGLPTGGRA